MHRILLPMDGSDTARRALAHLLTYCRALGKADIHLLNVQPAPVAWQTHGIGQETIVAHARARGEEITAEARRMLQEAGLAYELHVELGDAGETIARLAQELRCDGIFMGTRGLGVVGKLVLGSVAAKVLHLVDIPVTLVP
jgi:nucleotide-binding universal stress UspA family protein